MCLCEDWPVLFIGPYIMEIRDCASQCNEELMRQYNKTMKDANATIYQWCHGWSPGVQPAAQGPHAAHWPFLCGPHGPCRHNYVFPYSPVIAIYCNMFPAFVPSLQELLKRVYNLQVCSL